MTQAPYTPADLRTAAAVAIRAPSLHNSQPWLWRLRDGAIEVLIDEQRQLSVADHTGWAARIACGAALFNARLALAVNGTPARVQVRPDVGEPTLVARLTPGPARPLTTIEGDLFAAIPARHSNRKPFWPTPVASEQRVRLVEAAREEGAWLEVLVGMLPLTLLAEIARSADKVLTRDPDYRAELSQWVRTDSAPDGVPVTAGGVAPEPHDLLPQRNYTEHRRPLGRDFEPEPLVAVLGSAGNSAGDQINAGQALQRVLLTATSAGLASSMISQPIEVPTAREQVRRSLRRFGSPQMVLRIGYGQRGRPTPRRSVDEVIVD
ncbi:MAG TPA: nitroreductase family protein [Actinoplanes sp.]|nr:nitroreductase family protein [Actinoplanes sp.]